MSPPTGRIQNMLGDLRHELPAASAEFLDRVYAGGLDRYRRRLLQYGFAGRTRVLDAGCGFGQWSLALAKLAGTVEAIDVAAERLAVLNELAERLETTNLTTRLGDLTALPHGDGHFDAILCFSALQATPWRHCLTELRRVLARDGLLVVTANGLGHYLEMWVERRNASTGHDPRRHAAAAFANTLAYEAGQSPEGGLIIEPEELRDHLRSLGFSDIRMGAEGSQRGPGGSGPGQPPFFRGEYHGLPGVFEAVATR
jgi:SAM-dependent methyltransferase